MGSIQSTPLDIPAVDVLAGMSMLPELMAMGPSTPLKMGSLRLPQFLEQPSGFLLLDILPLVTTILAPLPTLIIYWKNRSYQDILLAAAFTFFAFMWHLCQMSMDVQSAAYLVRDYDNIS